MIEHPIIFSAPMVRAVLDGRKTMTRRVVKLPLRDPDFGCELDGNEIGQFEWNRLSPYGGVGDRLWVRESFQPLMSDDVAEEDWLSCNYKTGEGYKISYVATDGIVEYYNIGTDEAFCNRVTPSIFMPRWASRITLEVTGVRVERLQSISAKDIISEGAVARAHDDQFGHNPVSLLDGCVYLDLKSLWAAGWNKINSKRAPWASNPWVWVISFRRLP